MPPGPDDLDWLAFLYVSGELDDAGRVAFEARLDRDQSAREALAGAVGLIEAVATVTPDAGTNPIRPARLRLPARRLAWLAAAACLLLASLPAIRSPRAPGRSEAPTAEVALAWSDLQNQDEANPAAELLDPADPGPAIEAPSSPPSWLLLAASPSEATDPAESQPRED